MFTEAQLNAAIEAEVADWVRFFDVDERQGEDFEEQCEARRRFHRANIAGNHLGVLKQYLGIIPVMVYRLPEAEDALRKLAKKAERYGTPRITWKVGEPYEETRRTSEGRKYKIQMVDLALGTLAAPRVGKYTFIAKGEIVEGGAIVDSVPGEELPADVRKRLGTGECDHCGNNRMRKYTYAVRCDDGSVAVVGNSCLRDFLGTDTPASVAARFRWEQELRAFDEEFQGRGKGFPDSALELLAVTSAAIRLWGWVPKSAPESAGEPTALRIACWFARGMLSKGQKEDLEKLLKAVGDEDYKTAEDAMAWVASDESGNSDYIQNLRLILAPGAVESNRRGYACSAVASYQRYIGALEAKRKEKETAPESNWVGAVGERLRGLKLRLEWARGIGGFYGDTIIYKFKDEAGNMMTWFSSGGQELEVGQDYILDATVKGHTEYNGVKETQLTRGKVK